MTVRRLLARACALQAGALGLLVLLALACGRGGEPAPQTTAPPGTATPARAPTVPVVPPARETPQAPATPDSSPTPQAVSVEGPLLVLSERVGVGEDPDYRGTALRRIVIYDVGSERYWTAHEFRDARGDGEGLQPAVVRPAGTALLVLSEGELRRAGLSGETEAVLLTGGAVREILVSPDGANVAVMRGTPGTLLVLDALNGRELLRVGSDHPALGALRGGDRDGRLELVAWHADGEAVSVTADGGARTAVLSLGGDIRVLPPNALVSDDLRYAIRFGETIEASATTGHAPVWESLEVIDVATGLVIWTISDEAGIRPPPGDPPGWIRSNAPGYATFSDGGGTWVLDTNAGELLTRTPALERLLGAPVRSSCEQRAGYDRVGPCYVQYDGRVVWEGALAWTHYLGLIEVPGDLALEGTAPVAAVRVRTPPGPSSRSPVAGPLLVYEVRGYDEYVADGSEDAAPSPTTRLIAYDAGTRRAWTLFEGARAAQPARGGVVLSTDSPSSLLYVLPDGEVVELGTPGPFRVSPDGRMVAVRRSDGGDGARRTVVLAIPSGEELLSLADEDVPASLGLSLAGELTNWEVRLAGTAVAGAWTSDSGAVLLELHGIAGQDRDAIGVIAPLGGGANAVRCHTRDALSCLSPGGRYLVAGRAGGSDGYTESGWRSVDIIEVGADRVLRTVESARPLTRGQWEWTSDDYFAWSTELADLEGLRDGAGEVSVLDVRTGEIDVIDGAGYAARFHPPPRGATECPEHPARACQILLDGGTIMAGHWPRIVGLVEFDPRYPDWSSIFRFPPVAAPPSGPFEAISVGWRGACALTPEGEAVCWGNNSHGLEPVAGR